MRFLSSGFNAESNVEGEVLGKMFSDGIQGRICTSTDAPYHLFVKE